VSTLVSARRGEPTVRALVGAALAATTGADSPSVVVLLDPPETPPAIEPAAVVVVTADDAAVLDLAESIAPGGSLVSVGYSAAADLRAESVTVTLDGTTFTAVDASGSYPVRLALVGERHVPAALAALAAALRLGVEPLVALDALATVRSAEPGNLEIVARRGGSAIIDDGYDLTPLSTTEALKTLAEATRDRARSVAVLGDLDLDGETDAVEVREAHDRIGRLVVRLNVDRLIVVGQTARHIHNAAGLEGSWDGESVLVDTLDEAYDLLNDTELLADGPTAIGRNTATVLLVKTAASARLRPIAEALGHDTDTTERVTT
jgi:UDP-N-acetylmuramoyl-tripeptide--D-alanyl-D-alanine ligase